MNRDVRVCLATHENISDALLLLNHASGGHVPHEDPLDQDEQTFVALHGSQVIGAAVLVVGQDQTGWLWGPSVAGGFRTRHGQIAAALLDAVKRYADIQDAWMTQSLFEDENCLAAQALLANGFQRIVDAEMMEFDSANASVTRASLNPNALAFIDFTVDIEHRFHGVLKQTWTASQDCPILLGRRTPEEALRSHWHHTTGRAQDGLWCLMQDQATESDAGILLMSHDLEAAAIDIVYMGLTPAFRKQGLGKCLLDHATTKARQCGATKIRLAVDRENRPAVRLYRQFGFQLARSIHCIGRIHPDRT